MSFILLNSTLSGFTVAAEASASGTDYSCLVINEICSSNSSCLANGAGEYVDWVELYNNSDIQLSLEGIGLSDTLTSKRGKDKRFDFQFPEGAVIEPHGYVIVFCENGAYTETAGEYHADAFALSASGEDLYLSLPDTEKDTYLDHVSFPALATDNTYGRVTDGAENWAVFSSPTPGTSNASGTIRVDAPVFSAEGGFYADPFDLSLTDPSGNEIWYTTDGSDPRTSETAQLYSSAISIYDNTSEPNKLSAEEDIMYPYDPNNPEHTVFINKFGTYKAPDYNVDKGMVIKAACKSATGLYSGVITNSYFINKTAEMYQGRKIISLTMDYNDLFDPETGIYVNGNNKNFFQEPSWERPANIQVYENGTAAFSCDVGVRIAGASSRNYAQKSFNIFARSQYGTSKLNYDFFDGKCVDKDGKVIKKFDKITLYNSGNDFNGTHFLNRVVTESADGLSFSKQCMSDCIVFINGEFWGYYILQEKTDEHFISSHYGIDDNDITVVKVGNVDSGSDDLFNEYVDFLEWAKTADMSVDENYQRVCDFIDIHEYMQYIAFETYLDNWDWGTNNWIIWRSNNVIEGNPYADGKWRFVLYDTDSTCSRHAYDSINNLFKEFNKNTITALFYKLLENDTFCKEFYECYLDMIENNFDNNVMADRIDRFNSEKRNLVEPTFDRFNVDRANYDNAANHLRYYFAKRANYAVDYLRTALAHEVSFNTNGGSETVSQTIGYEMSVTKPADPEKEGFVFGGWYKDPEFAEAWDFENDTVTSDTTLYAKWNEIAKFTVTFETYGGSVIDPIITAAGTILPPADPQRDGFIFGGWYSDPECTVIWNFLTDIVNSDMTLYASWYPSEPVEPEEPISAFVERLYNNILGRTSDTEGKTNHIQNIQDGETACRVAYDFIFSPEFTNMNLTNEERVRRMYLTLLDREPDAEGLAVWTEMLDNGCSIGKVFYGFIHSNEFTIVCQNYGISRGSWEITENRDKSPELTAFVSRLYTNALGRSNDIDGLNSHTGRYLESKDIYQLSYDFIFSPEYMNKNLSDEDFVENMYETFFDRHSDVSGKAEWLTNMKNGMAREDILIGFVDSPEFKALMAKFGI